MNPGQDRTSPDTQIRACDVCRLVNDDLTPKPTRYCSLCDSWICAGCRTKWTWRAVAALKSVKERAKMKGEEPH